MSNKIDVKNENDLDINEDNDWDDWGDAEDNIPEESGDMQGSVANITLNSGNNNASLKSNKTDSKYKNNNFTSATSQTPEQSVQCSQSTGWGSLFGGVVSSVLSTANELTTTVTHGFDKVIGVPDPVELARLNVSETKIQENKIPIQQNSNTEDRSLTPTNATPTFGLGLVNNVTFFGSKVINSGLDTLEGIGKKTMNMLQENDPLLKDKIKKLGLEQEKPNLSEILKEAKQENEQWEQSLKELSLEKSRAQLRFEILFENNCGLVHLEALEILSKESHLKIQTLKESVSGKALEELMETINEVKELMELEDLDVEPESEEYSKDDLEDNLQKAIEDTELQIQFEDIINLWLECTTWLRSEQTSNLDAEAIFGKGITALVKTCSYEMLKLHKIAELLLVKDHHSTANEVDGIVQLCKQFCMHLQTIANRFATHLSTHAEENKTKSHINTLFADMVKARQQIEKHSVKKTWGINYEAFEMKSSPLQPKFSEKLWKIC